MVDGLISVGGTGFVAAVAPSYQRFWYLTEVISPGMGLYHRFPFSFHSAPHRTISVIVAGVTRPVST